MTTFDVTAKRWTHGWELHIDGVGVTQSKGLGASAERMVRDYLRLELGDKKAKAATIRITPHVDDATDREVAQVRHLADELAQRQAELAKRSRQLVERLLVRKRLTGVDVAAVLDVSPQRVSQLSPAAIVSEGASRPGGGAGGRKLAAKRKAAKTPAKRAGNAAAKTTIKSSGKTATRMSGETGTITVRNVSVRRNQAATTSARQDAVHNPGDERR